MELCLGTVQFGTQYGIQGNARPRKQEVFDIITDALAHGIHWFDTASAYGTAEELLGDYIEEHPGISKEINIASKLAPNALTNIPTEKKREIILSKIQESLNRLHRQQLDVYMFHNASHIFDEEAVAALDAVRHEGLARSIGVSVYTPLEAMKALSYPQIEVIQVPYNVFDRRLDQCGFFVEAKKKNVTVFARSSLLQGLAVMDANRLPAHMEFASPYLKVFHSICDSASSSPLHAAISSVAGHPGIDYLLFGVDNQDQLSNYLSFVSKPLPQEVESALRAAFDKVEEKLVNPSLW
ncbi:Aldo-keto reductase YhdN [Firmicutes bacterium ASF500]|nr:Aldo-keto reductase YhdN [Firmicutes bacterium ASF500]